MNAVLNADGGGRLVPIVAGAIAIAAHPTGPCRQPAPLVTASAFVATHPMKIW